MSATTPVPQPDDFDAAVDAYMDEAAQPQGQPAPAPVAESPKPEASQPATEQQTQQAKEAPQEARPAAAGAPEPQEDDSDDEALDLAERFTRAQKREERLRQEAKAEVEAERRKVLSYQGNLAQEAKRREQLAAELAENKRLLESESARIDKLWTDAIAQTTDQDQKAELERQYALEKRTRDLDMKEQQARFAEDQARQQREAAQAQHFTTMREVATAELPLLLDRAAQELKLPPTLLQPVKDYVNSPAMRALARTLPLFAEQPLQGDPANWPLDRIGSLHELRQHLERQAELGLEHYRKEHEAAQVKANQQAAAKTYRQEQPVGAGVGRQGKSWDEMDADEALDAWFAQR